MKLINQKWVFLLSILTIIVLLAGCGGSTNETTGNENNGTETPQEQPSANETNEQPENSSDPNKLDRISIGGSSPGGHYYPLSVAMGQMITDHIDGVTGSGEETGGSRANVGLMQSNEIEIGFTTADVGIAAFKGEAPFDQKFNILLGWKLMDDTLQIIALEKSGISTIEDLKGKTVSVGPSGSAANIMGQQVLEMHGLNEGDYKVQFMDDGPMIDALVDGLLDAGMFMGAYPIPIIEGLTAREEISVIPFDQDKAEQLVKPASPVEMPAGTYEGQDQAVTIVGIPSFVWFRSDLSEQQVYEITKVIFENMDEIEKIDAVASQTRLYSKAEVEDLGLEAHPGVIKYAQEIGVWE